MKVQIAALVLILVGGVAGVPAHDLFLKPKSFFQEPKSTIHIPVLNGTFGTSEASVDLARIADLSVVSPAGVTHLETSAWSARGDASLLTLRTAEAGTYVIGVSIRPRELTLDGAAFNAYLHEDGMTDVLDARRTMGTLERSARERYSKHVKAILQIGDELGDAYATQLGYPAEIIPLSNPYSLNVGDTLHVRCFADGEAVPDVTVIAGGESGGTTIAIRKTKTDADGVASIAIDMTGKWFVKFIRMVSSPEPELDYESKWATLTFEMR